MVRKHHRSLSKGKLQSGAAEVGCLSAPQAQAKELIGGRAHERVLFDWTVSVVTWSRVAHAQGIDGFAGLLLVASNIVERYRVTGQIRLSPQEKTAVAASAMVMEVLEDVIDLDGDRIVGPWSMSDISRVCELHRRTGGSLVH